MLPCASMDCSPAPDNNSQVSSAFLGYGFSCLLKRTCIVDNPSLLEMKGCEIKVPFRIKSVFALDFKFPATRSNLGTNIFCTKMQPRAMITMANKFFHFSLVNNSNMASRLSNQHAARDVRKYVLPIDARILFEDRVSFAVDQVAGYCIFSI